MNVEKNYIQFLLDTYSDRKTAMLFHSGNTIHHDSKFKRKKRKKKRMNTEDTSCRRDCSILFCLPRLITHAFEYHNILFFSREEKKSKR